MPEYVRLLASMIVDPRRAPEIERWAQKLAGPLYWPRYEQVQGMTAIPGELIAALDYRESSANPRCALGQGDLWSEVSRHYPSGCGPFASWVAAAAFYIHREHFDDHSHEWSWPYACWKIEGWNGFGPRNHGIHTGYLWAGTNHYYRGKYVADGEWDQSAEDKQIGAIPLMMRIMEIRGTSLPGMPGKVVALGPKPMPAPLGVGATPSPGHDVLWLQAALNKVLKIDLITDGLYGRETRSAVRDYQKLRGLTVDGLFGPKTDEALTGDLKAAA
jgi:lysozyme family protein